MWAIFNPIGISKGELMIDWFREYESILVLLGLLSACSVAMALFLTPWALSLISAEYFLPNEKVVRPPVLQLRRCVILGLRNLLGAALVILGVVLLALPGQGLLTIFAGLLLMSFPGKRSLELRLVRLPFVLKSVNWSRARRGRGPLQLPCFEGSNKDSE
ncbi:MAG: PGPGW domain-containing protein [Roseibacillus sp.]|nr:PGPGW domain-containing protein [Roseibacillus sp.]